MGCTFTVAEKRALQEAMLRETHVVYVVSFEQLDAVVRSSLAGQSPDVQKLWEEIKNPAAAGANYYAAADDATKLAKLVGDLGAVGARVYFKTYNGKRHIILKGHAGLRSILTGTRYGIQHPKVITMGLGKAGAIKAVKQGGLLTIVLLTGYRVIDYFFTDSVTLAHLFGSLATDILKVGIATGASLAAVAAFGAMTFAIGPLLAVLIVGTLVTFQLERLDQQLKLTNHVIEGLEEMGRHVDRYIAARRCQADAAVNQAVYQVIDYIVDEMQVLVERWVFNKLDQLERASRRVW